MIPCSESIERGWGKCWLGYSAVGVIADPKTTVSPPAFDLHIQRVGVWVGVANIKIATKTSPEPVSLTAFRLDWGLRFRPSSPPPLQQECGEKGVMQ